MKGLILKDLYMIKSYCRVFMLSVLIFLAVSLLNEESFVFFVYPCMLCGMIPVTLISYDERFRWQQYSAALPCTRRQLVVSKYLIGLISELAAIVLTGTAHAVKALAVGSFVPRSLLSLLAVAFFAALTFPSITLPFIFKFGAEKGRVAFYGAIGVMCALFVVVSRFEQPLFDQQNGFGAAPPVLVLAGLAVYALSCCLSIALYGRREF